MSAESVDPPGPVRWRDYWPLRAEEVCAPDAGVHLGCEHADRLEPSPPDVVPREEVGAPSQPSPASFPSARYRELDPVPGWARRHWRGDCTRCRRPMASAQARRSDPRLRRCYVRVASGGLCKACDERRRQGLDDRPPAEEPSAEVRRPLPEHEVRALRATVTCLGCGRSPGEALVGGRAVVRTRHRRGCPVARVGERDP